MSLTNTLGHLVRVMYCSHRQSLSHDKSCDTTSSHKLSCGTPRRLVGPAAKQNTSWLLAFGLAKMGEVRGQFACGDSCDMTDCGLGATGSMGPVS